MTRELAFNIVKKHIDEWDPIGLLALGVPEDEYHVEVMMVAEKFSTVMNVIDLMEVIQDVFNEMFYDGDGTMKEEDCEEVSYLIWNEIMELQKAADRRRFKSGARRKSKT